MNFLRNTIIVLKPSSNLKAIKAKFESMSIYLHKEFNPFLIANPHKGMAIAIDTLLVLINCEMMVLINS